MRKSLLTALLMLPAACASPGDHAPRAGSLPGPVTYEARSWGRILLHWQIAPDGTGEIWRGAGGKSASELRKYHLRLQGEGLHRFAAAAEQARQATLGGIPCKKQIFDLPYGTMTWNYPGAQQTYAFDAGCRSERGDAAMDLLHAADQVIQTMAAIDADPYITEDTEHR